MFHLTPNEIETDNGKSSHYVRFINGRNEKGQHGRGHMKTVIPLQLTLTFISVI